VAGSGLSSFANPGGPSQIVGLQGGSSRFGATADDDEEEEGDEDEEEGETAKSEVKSPKLDPERKVIGKGEEDEETEFSARAKLFAFKNSGDDKGWKERGMGTLKFNINYMGKKARLILRNDSTGRMVLNSPIQDNLDFGMKDAKPTNGLIVFQGCLAKEASDESGTGATEGSAIETLQLKVRQSVYNRALRALHTNVLRS